MQSVIFSHSKCALITLSENAVVQYTLAFTVIYIHDCPVLEVELKCF